MHYLSHLMHDFKHKTTLPRQCQVSVETGTSGLPCLAIDDPVVIARFISFVKSRANGGEVFIRGQDQDHPGMTPGLFRRCTDAERLQRAQAYLSFIDRLHTALPHNRFRRDNMGAMLQHYGFKTPWIDLVDNLFIAVWFASHTYDMARDVFTKSPEPFGWLYLVVTGSKPDLIAVDLRKRHSSMNTRLQAQHGISGGSQTDGEPIGTFDYGDAVAARIRFPRTRRFGLSGRFFQPPFLFPKPDLDETYDIILKSRVNELAAQVERANGFTAPVLGRASRLRYRAPRTAA